jgi:ATP-dependent HslUV protease ATP-binding subunit HslU
LLAAEGLNIAFSPDCIQRLAEIAWQVNERTENIGARRLHTVLEKLLEEISFNAGDLAAEHHERVLTITAADVEQHLGGLVQDEDLSRFIL